MEGKQRYEDEDDDFPDFSGEEEEEEAGYNKKAGYSDSDGSGSGSGSSSGSDEDEDDDSDFDASFAESVDNGRDGAKKGGSYGEDNAIQVKEVENQPYDAKVDLEGSFSDESVDTTDTGTPKMRQPTNGNDFESKTNTKKEIELDRGDSPPRNSLTSPNGGNLSETEEIPGGVVGKKEGKVPEDDDEEDEDDDDDESSGNEPRRSHNGVKLEAGSDSMKDAARRMENHKFKYNEQEGDDDDDEEEEEETESSASTANRNKGTSGIPVPGGGYNPRDFDHLDVSNEVKELFQYIGRYKPHDIELDTRLRCFIPDYIPAVGDIDAFMKIPRPDMQPDELGLKVLDEPAASQSDATVLDLQLRAISKKSVKNPMIVRSIEHANKDKKAVQNWIDSIKELHRSKPPPQVHYTKPMPDIESLMQVWPEEVEQLIKQIQLPSADIDLDLKDYARVVCAILDIPVFSSMVEPLHVLFTLYSEFKDNQHFNNNNH